jgi:uncharacterized membrane protein
MAPRRRGFGGASPGRRWGSGSASVVGLALLLLLAVPVGADRTLVIQSLDATIDVAPDGSIVVFETIVPRFTGSWNGIFRTIPVQYRTPQGLNYTLRLDVETVTDAEGRTLKYENSRERHYRKLKIWVPGAADTTRVVQLRYRVPNGLRFFDEHDELYWNVTGDEWEVPIESASAHVRLPAGVSGVRATAFRGAYGSTERTDVSIAPDGVRVRTTRGLGMREGLTIVVGWNPGIVHRPTVAEKTASTVYANLPLAIPPLVFFGMLRLWRKRGRDPELAPIATQYEPPAEMTPAELGTLIDGKPDMRDITASIVDLAVRGYLHIAETVNERFFGLLSNREYTFTLKKERGEWAALKQHERDLLGAMFTGSGNSVSLSDLKNKFYKHLPGLRNELYGRLVKDGFYTGRPDRVRLLYIAGGIAVGALIGFASGSIMTSFGMQPAAGIVAGVLSALVIVFFGWFMPSRTVRGTRELEKVLGFREFLSRVEGDRLERMVKTPAMFERFLPYAMALGVEDNWAKAFDGIYTQPPSWYSGPGGVGTFRPASFTHNLGVMSTAAAATMASAPRSSGGSGFRGGSSGGGFGGGGGGGF